MERAIATATFRPQAAAFTALLKMCAKDRQWEKALEACPRLHTLAQHALSWCAFGCMCSIMAVIAMIAA